MGQKDENRECRAIGETNNPRPGGWATKHKELNEHTAKGGKSTSHKDVGLGVPRSADAGATYPLQEARRRQSDWRRGAMEKIIQLEIYDRGILFVIEPTWEKAKKHLKKYFAGNELQRIKELSEILYTDSSCVGRTIDMNGYVMVLMKSVPDTSLLFGKLVHELFHAVSYTMEEVGIVHSSDTEEAYAYMIGYLAEKVITSFGLFQRRSLQDAT